MEPSGTRIPGDAASQLEYISPIGYSRSSRCGYCGTRGKGQSQSFSYYANTLSMSPKFYQTLLDRYWRRSGTLIYRPDQRHSCCPHYTIRLDSSEFKPSRDHRQTINRFNRYVTGEAYTKEAAKLYPRSREEAKKRDNQFDLIERIHEAELSCLKTPPQPAHDFVVTLEDNSFTEEKFQVYENYQRVVHKESPSDIDRKGFKRFLCDSPLRHEVLVAPDGRKRRLGSYHQCYRLDGKLVAIGVLDLLPDCVSSVYFLYDESIHKHTPGKLGGLYEIALAMEEGYRWWYPGFYIHSCPKMRYKMDFAPQYVLDPEALTWDIFDQELMGLMDKKKYVSFSSERSAAASEKSLVEKDGDDQVMEGAVQGEEDDEAEDDEDEVDEASAESDDDDYERRLFRVGMPGIPPISTIAALDLDHMALRMSFKGPLFEMCDLVSWSQGSIEDWPSWKAMAGELIAAIGPDVIDQICFDFARRSKG